MWTSGIMQGLMLSATTDGGTVLKYPNFLDTLNAIRPMMLMRVIGGTFYLAGFLLMAYNMWRTVRGAVAVNGSIEVFADEEHGAAAPAGEPALPRLGLLGTFFNPPVLFSVLGFGFSCAWMFGGNALSIAGLVGTLLCVILAFAHFESRGKSWAQWYDRLLVTTAPFTILTFIAVAAAA
jgi:cytochrome c oxidase cbb3-type subunit I/II